MKNLSRFEYKIGPNSCEFILPIRTVSEMNCTKHWRVKATRHKAQKNETTKAMIPIRNMISLPCKILVVRHGPRFLDAHDNLPASQKYIIDAICENITGNFIPGRADNYSEFTFKYDQIKSKKIFTKVVLEFPENANYMLYQNLVAPVAKI